MEHASWYHTTERSSIFGLTLETVCLLIKKPNTTDCGRSTEAWGATVYFKDQPRFLISPIWQKRGEYY